MTSPPSDIWRCEGDEEYLVEDRAMSGASAEATVGDQTSAMTFFKTFLNAEISPRCNRQIPCFAGAQTGR